MMISLPAPYNQQAIEAQRYRSLLVERAQPSVVEAFDKMYKSIYSKLAISEDLKKISSENKKFREELNEKLVNILNQLKDFPINNNVNPFSMNNEVENGPLHKRIDEIEQEINMTVISKAQALNKKIEHRLPYSIINLMF